MSLSLYSIKDFDLKNQKVFIRTDFNIPVENGKVEDHIRLQSALPTIRHALENQAKVIIASHRGKPEKQNKKEFTLEPFGYHLSQLLNCETLFIEEIEKAVPSFLLSSLNEKKIILLENLRFHPAEEQGDPDWADVLASYVDIYINEAFSVAHRKHASVTTLPQKIKKRGCGFSMTKEMEVLDYVRKSSPRPFALLAGGVKVSDKIKLITRLIDRVDKILIGGVMAYTFLKAKGFSVGGAFVQTESLQTAKDFMERLKLREKELLLPLDHLVVPINGEQKQPQVTSGADVPEGFCPMDIGPKTRASFSRALEGMSTIFWNGPFGKFENPLFAKGTLAVCESIAKCTGAFRVVGGGNSISAVLKSGHKDCFNYISTGGGAALKYLREGSLHGIQSLMYPKGEVLP